MRNPAPGGQRRGFLKPVTIVLALSLLVACHVTAGHLLSPASDSIVFLWPVSGFLAVALAFNRGAIRVPLLVLPLLAAAVVLWLLDGRWQAGVVPVAGYALEAVLVTALLDRTGWGSQLLRNAGTFIRFALLGAVGPSVLAAAGGGWLAHLTTGEPWLDAAFTWLRVDSINIMVCIAATLGLREGDLRPALTAEQWRRAAPAAGAVILLAAAAIAVGSFPFLVLPGMMLVVFAADLAATGLTLAAVSAILLIGGSLVQDTFPLPAIVTPSGRIILLQSFVTILSLTTLAVALALDDRKRLSAAHEQAKAQLAQTNRFLQSILESAGIGIVARDAAYRIRAYNPAAEQIFGLARDAVMGRTDLMATSGAAGIARITDYAAVADMLVTRHGRYEQEVDLVRADGATVPAQVTVSMVRAEDGEPSGFVTLVQDISARRAQERHVADLIESLRGAREEAEFANAAKSEFLAAMSHEIRTPLNGVIGFAELMLQSPLTTEQRQYVLLQREAGKSLLALVNDILDYSRIEAGRIEIDRQRFDLHRVVRDCVDFVAQSASLKGLPVSVAIAPEVPKGVVGDDLRIRQILLNLLTNAIKFTERGSIRLAVALSPRGDGRLRFAVTDTGIGIAEDKLSLLFQRFSQADRSTTRRFGGSGLGLAICKRLVELMEGEIGVRTVHGAGSTFWFELLLPPAEAGGTLTDIEGLPAGPVRPGRILVVEDVEMNRVLARAVLSGAGHSVVMAENGVEAVTAVATQKLDLVLMDVQMPLMDGIEAARTIRSLPGPAAGVPIIALTATAQDSEIRKCRAAGMNDHVTKPFTAAGLLQAVDRWIASGPADREMTMSADFLNLAQIEALETSLGRDQMSGLIQTFATDIRARMTRLDEAAIGPDLRREAHAMTSLVGNLGLDHACQTSRALMNLDGSPDATEVAARLRDLRVQVEQGLAELERRYPGAA